MSANWDTHTYIHRMWSACERDPCNNCQDSRKNPLKRQSIPQWHAAELLAEYPYNSVCTNAINHSFLAYSKPMRASKQTPQQTGESIADAMPPAPKY